jgi:hypothetical protein
MTATRRERFFSFASFEEQAPEELKQMLIRSNLSYPNTKKYTTMATPNPKDLIGDDAVEIPEVEQLGTITLEKLNEYHCNNPDRRLLSLFGEVFDVTSSEKSYGKEGACKLL